MNIPEEFGKYLLLKKLREDSLGETFRAGRAGKEGIEQVVLLRVFNGQGLDGEKLWQKMSGRAAVQQGLRSPNIGSGLDLGKVRSFPFTAYDYISGKNLETLIAQASRQRLPIPVDHALLITERLALALAAAYETRLQDERILHGFVVPQLVMISNEGETRLLGFEVAPGLLTQFAAGWQPDEVRSYVAPEAAAGAPLVKTDDLYSLGVILYELLTGERLPAPQSAPPGGYAALIDDAVLPAEGTPLPAPVVALLKKSLVPREQRIADATTWHKAISKLMIEGHYGSTTFNLAFFMHNLFRDEIDRETQELQAEKRLALPARTATPPPAAAPAEARPDMRESTGVRDAAWASSPPPAAAGSLAGRKTLWIGLAAGIAALALGGWFVFGRSAPAAKKTPAPAAAGAAQPSALSSGASGAPGAATAAAAKEAALQAQIQQMIESGSKAMEAKLKTQYDDQIKQLQRKLEESKRATADQERGRGERASASARETETVATSAEGRGAAKSDPAPSTTELGAAAQQQSAGSRAASPAGSAAKGAANAAAPSGAGTGGAPGSPAAGSPAVPAANAAQTAGRDDSEAAQRQPQVQIGDLVQAGPGVVSPKVVIQPDARYPVAARTLNRSAQVGIKVLVDERGRVMEAQMTGTPSGFGFDEAAVDAARRTTFQPATKDGVRVRMWTTLRVNFKPRE